ncbi:MAG: hypothetical protein PHS82_06960 [Lachnospiraceae bacterium]|nr:hypothetical protein [Lachnospiraceae bacterium]
MKKVVICVAAMVCFSALFMGCGSDEKTEIKKTETPVVQESQQFSEYPKYFPDTIELGEGDKINISVSIDEKYYAIPFEIRLYIPDSNKSISAMESNGLNSEKRVGEYMLTVKEAGNYKMEIISQGEEIPEAAITFNYTVTGVGDIQGGVLPLTVCRVCQYGEGGSYQASEEYC